MIDDVTILVATFGDTSWADLALARAIPSAEATGAPVIHRHGLSIAQARNEALELARTDWVVHLDADDELEAGYLEALEALDADLRAPAVRYVDAATGRPSPNAAMPRVHGHRHRCIAECLFEGNWLVVGTAVERRRVLEAGGWIDWPVYEDWHLWARVWAAGATIAATDDAVYRAHADRSSRNRGTARAVKDETHKAIERAVWPERFEAAA